MPERPEVCKSVTLIFFCTDKHGSKPSAQMWGMNQGAGHMQELPHYVLFVWHWYERMLL